MMRARTFGSGAILMLLVSTACSRDGSDEGSRKVDVLVVSIRDVVGAPPAADSREALPVVYVVGVGEHEVAATVQSDVADQLQDEVDVRFADGRDEAIETGETDQPVRDSGVLLMVGDVPEEGNPVDVPIEIYRSELDTSTVVFTVAERASTWVVTATSQVTDDA